MDHRSRGFALLLSLFLLTLLSAPAAAVFDVSWGNSWEGVPLQDVIDNFLSSQFPSTYSPGDVNALTMYEGYLPGDADLSPKPYWQDSDFTNLIVTELAGYQWFNTMGWYEIGYPEIDGFNDGVIFTGGEGPGNTKTITFSSPTQFGFWLDPNGDQDAEGAPQPEKFYTDRTLNDVGPDGSGTVHGPEGGDPQCLIYNVSYLYGKPAYILAWEDLDSGLPLAASYAPGYTDNDYNDLVVLILASSPVPTQSSSWGRVKSLFNQR
ncbi:MAG TPA: hypothetical protein VKA63_00515 [Candidatus Krumholzibacteria bacterium]|nr:hypothetical protein [Candidatus Krumholzibacteria bacterium]